MGPIIRISDDPAGGCYRDNGEAVPELSWAAGTARLFAGYSIRDYNWATGVDVNMQIPPPSPIPQIDTAKGDAWATTAGGAGSGLNYISNIASPGPGSFCIGIAATPPTLMGSNVWSSFLRCMDAPKTFLEDGPAIHYDGGGTTLWAVAVSYPDYYLYIMDNCQAGDPGGTSCPITYHQKFNDNLGTSTHANVINNPCEGHNGIVAYRRLNGDPVLQFFKRDGTKLNTFMHGASSGGTPYTAQNQCGPYVGKVPKCTGPGTTDCATTAGGQGCLVVFPRPMISTKVVGSTCYAYVSYDHACPNNSNYWKSNLDVIDITHDSNPQVVARWISADCTQTSNHFNSTVGSPNGNGVGWFWYTQQSANACSTIFSGATDTAYGLSSMAYTAPLDGPFPSMRIFGDKGIGDYTGSAVRGVTGGKLWPAWARPFPTSLSNTGSGCATCQSTQNNYTMAVYGRSVTP
jgi:hypothetical protein